jgi:hypothetical protein
MKKYLIRFIVALPTLGVGFAAFIVLTLMFNQSFNWIVKLMLAFTVCGSSIGFITLLSDYEEHIVQFKKFIKTLYDDSETGDIPCEEI